MINKSNILYQNPQCTNTQQCFCQTCKRQTQIIQMLDKKTYLEWFGKKKMLYHIQSPLIKKQHINQDLSVQKIKKMKAKKNQESDKNFNKKYINLNSSYLQNYNIKEGTRSNICSPVNQIQFQKPFQQIKSVYVDNYKILPFYQPDKIIKPSQAKFNLPFLGKSSYKSDFLVLKRSKSNIISPKDNIVDRNLILRFEQINDKKNKAQIKRPVSPIIQKDNQIQPKALSSNYNTNYQVQFEKKLTQEQQNMATITKKEQLKYHNHFLRKSKFGSFSKNRWITQNSKQLSLSPYN